MPKIKVLFTALTFLMLFGTISIAGAVSDGTYNSQVASIYGQNGNYAAYFTGKDSFGNTIGWIFIDSNAPTKNEIYTTLNSAVWAKGTAIVYVTNGKIVGAQT